MGRRLGRAGGRVTGRSYRQQPGLGPRPFLLLSFPRVLEALSKRRRDLGSQDCSLATALSRQSRPRHWRSQGGCQQVCDWLASTQWSGVKVTGHELPGHRLPGTLCACMTPSSFPPTKEMEAAGLLEVMQPGRDLLKVTTGTLGSEESVCRCPLAGQPRLCVCLLGPQCFCLRQLWPHRPVVSGSEGLGQCQGRLRGAQAAPGGASGRSCAPCCWVHSWLSLPLSQLPLASSPENLWPLGVGWMAPATHSPAGSQGT